MEPVYRWELVVPQRAVDANGHVNNVVYVEWLQEVARRHAEAAGCTGATRAAGATWVVREHRIQYLRPGFGGERLEVRTWVATMQRARSLRRTEVARAADGALLARGWTDWVFVDAAGGHPRLIPPGVAGTFTLVPEPPAGDRGARRAAAGGGSLRDLGPDDLG